MPYRITGLERV